MPSPAGHALGGIAAAWLIHRAPARWPRSVEGWWREALLFACLAMLPDVDLLIGVHRGPSHAIATALLVGLVAYAIPQRRDAARLRFAAACASAFGSHILLDWLGTDTSAPFGVMALWPLSREFYESDLRVFMAVSRRYRQPEVFWVHNLTAFARELVVLLPVLGIVWWLRRET